MKNSRLNIFYFCKNHQEQFEFVSSRSTVSGSKKRNQFINGVGGRARKRALKSELRRHRAILKLEFC